MALPLSKQGKTNGERRHDKWTDQGSPDQYFFIARKSNVLSCSETVEVTKEPETALYLSIKSTDISTSILPGMDRLVN